MKYYYNHKTGKRYWRDDNDPEGFAFRPLPNKERETFHVLSDKIVLSSPSPTKNNNNSSSKKSNNNGNDENLEDGDFIGSENMSLIDDMVFL